MHRIRVEWVGTDRRGRPRYRAQVIRLATGLAVWTSEISIDAEQCWEDAARYWRAHLDGDWPEDDDEVTAEYPRPQGPYIEHRCDGCFQCSDEEING